MSEIKNILTELGIVGEGLGLSTGTSHWTGGGRTLTIHSPVDGQLIGTVNQANEADYDQIMQTAQAAFVEWRSIPAPKRGEVVRQMGEALRVHKENLGALVSYEMGEKFAGRTRGSPRNDRYL